MSYKWVRKWTSESWTDKHGKCYVVSVSVDGVWGCSCPEWIFRRNECHHIQEVKAAENWKEGDLKSLLQLTALRVEKLRKKGKSEKEIEKDLCEVLHVNEKGGETIESNA